jgi:hypothetical protein
VAGNEMTKCGIKWINSVHGMYSNTKAHIKIGNTLTEL